MSDLTRILSAAGLAGAAGHRAFVPPLLLGLAHHAGWMTLHEKFAWLADPKVLAILGVLAIVEHLAEKNPDAPELVTLALKLPKAVSGFLVAAAAVGDVDGSLVALSASGVLGGATSLGVDTMRAGVKHAIQEPLSDATNGLSDKAMSAAETTWSGVMTWLAWAVPVIALAGLAVLAGVWIGRRKVAEAARVACACGYKRHADAKVCPGCKAVVA